MQYFTISELLRSDTAIAARMWNGASAEAERNMVSLVENILDPLRRAWGRPITVTSGYRSPALNRMVGGVETSQHCKGEAADITALNPEDNRALARLAVELGLHFDQLINEKGWAWVHISYKASGANRRQLLRYDGKIYMTMKEEEI